MKDRTKWILVGLGFTFGLQVIISLVFTGIAYSAARNGADVLQDPLLMVAFGLSLGAFLIGGFVIGWMSEEVRVMDSVFVTLATMALISLVYVALPHGNRGQFVSGYGGSDRSILGLARDRAPGRSARPRRAARRVAWGHHRAFRAAGHKRERS